MNIVFFKLGVKLIKSMNPAWWVERWSDLHPDKPAIIFEDEKITYLELHRRANRTGRWLQSVGIEKGDRVAVLLHNCPEFLDLYLACTRLGAIFVPINFRSAVPELDYFINNSRPRIFIFDEEYAEKIDSLKLENSLSPIVLTCIGAYKGGQKVIDYCNGLSNFENNTSFLACPLNPADPEEPQVIMYTSGTTGRPKGAVLTHHKTFFNCLNADIFFKLHFDDVMLIILPLFHSGGLFIQAAPTIYKGATLVIHPKFDPLSVYKDIEKYRITTFLGVPTVYKALVDIPVDQRGDISSLKVCAGGGEKTTPDLLQKCREAGLGFRQVMGQTETSILLWASEEDSFRKPGTVGRPVFHAEVNIVDKNGRTVKPGEIGEIVVRGSIVMKEYWQDPARTEETLKNGSLYTGDLARMDKDGYFYLVDRAKDMYITGGENVYPAEIERTLKEHPEIEDIAMVGIPDETWGEVGHAFVIRKQDSNLSAEEIFNFSKEKLAAFKCPKKVTFASEFPRNTLGKVIKRKLIQ